ncbi:hypothetical protein BDR06DRAFT_1071158 [Suillus hirtellus]|nr:hypothetical protein BDR06DRAFT_1071158 [Suillus hirtellus]
MPLPELWLQIFFKLATLHFLRPSKKSIMDQKRTQRTLLQWTLGPRSFQGLKLLLTVLPLATEMLVDPHPFLISWSVYEEIIMPLWPWQTSMQN